MLGLLGCFGRGSPPQKFLDASSSLGSSLNEVAPAEFELKIFSLEGKELGHVREQDIWEEGSTRPHLAIRIVNPNIPSKHTDSRDQDSAKRLLIWKAANRVRDSLSRPGVAGTPSPLCYLEPNFVSTSFKTNLKLEGNAYMCFSQLLESLSEEGDELLNLCASAVGAASREGGCAPRVLSRCAQMFPNLGGASMSIRPCYLSKVTSGDLPSPLEPGIILELLGALAKEDSRATPLLEVSALNPTAVAEVDPVLFKSLPPPIVQWNFTAERGLAVAEVNPGMCTVVTMNEAEVLFQSRNSREFWGDVTGRKLSPTHSFLHCLFRLQPDLLNEMLQDMQLGEVWHRVIQVKQSNQLPSPKTSPSLSLNSLSARKYNGSLSSCALATVSPKVSRKLTRNTTVTFEEGEDPQKPPTPDMGSSTPSMRGAGDASSPSANSNAPHTSSGQCGNMSNLLLPGMIDYEGIDKVSSMTSMTPAGSRSGSVLSAFSSMLGMVSPTIMAYSSSPVISNSVPIVQGQRLSFLSRQSRPGTAGEMLPNSQLPAMSLRAVSFIQRTNSKRVRRASSMAVGDTDLLVIGSTELSVPAAEEGDGMGILSHRWHEIHATCIVDPHTEERVISIYQSDVTDRTELQSCLTELTETQLKMLQNMYPRHVLEYITDTDGPREAFNTIASSHADVTILFMDIVGFTSMSKAVAPKAVMAYLNELFTCLDDLVTTYKVYKVETAGDCYIVAGGLMTMDDEGFVKLDESPDAKDGALRAAKFGKAALACASRVLYPHTQQPTIVRVGMHTGSCVSGLIGNKQMKYGLFGDTMNTASRMESTCKPSCLQVSETTYLLLPEDMQAGMEATGGIEVKGKGLMSTYVYTGETEDLSGARQSDSKISSKLSSRSMRDILSKQQATIAKMKNAMHTQDSTKATGQHIGRTSQKTALSP